MDNALTTTERGQLDRYSKTWQRAPVPVREVFEAAWQRQWGGTPPLNRASVEYAWDFYYAGWLQGFGCRVAEPDWCDCDARRLGQIVCDHGERCGRAAEHCLSTGAPHAPDE